MDPGSTDPPRGYPIAIAGLDGFQGENSPEQADLELRGFWRPPIDEHTVVQDVEEEESEEAREEAGPCVEGRGGRPQHGKQEEVKREHDKESLSPDRRPSLDKRAMASGCTLPLVGRRWASLGPAEPLGSLDGSGARIRGERHR